MNNEVSLDGLNVTIKYLHDHFLFEMDQMFLNHPRFISSVKDFKLNFQSNENLPKFLTALPSSSIKHLEISVDRHNSYAKDLKDLIQSQSQLSSLSLGLITPNDSLLNALRCCSNTLTCIKFIHCDFTNVLSSNGFNHLTHLKSLQFIYCQGTQIPFFQSLLDHPDPLKIKSLKVVGLILGTDLLIQKVGPYLEHLELEIGILTERKRAFRSVIDHCNQMKFLRLTYVASSNIFQLYDIISQNKKHLKYLSLQNKQYRCLTDVNLSTSSLILKGLGPTLPSSLGYLDLDLAVNPYDLGNFLGNCKHLVGLNTLLVRSSNNKDIDATWNVLKEFVGRNHVKNFVYQVDDDVLERLRDLQDSVNMKRYEDLVVRISDLDV